MNRKLIYGGSKRDSIHDPSSEVSVCQQISAVHVFGQWFLVQLFKLTACLNASHAAVCHELLLVYYLAVWHCGRAHVLQVKAQT